MAAATAAIMRLRVAQFILHPQRMASRPLLSPLPACHSRHNQKRHSSHAPSPSPASLPAGAKPVTIQTIRDLHRKNIPITMLTAHDFPSASLAAAAGMDIILVGDSLAMVSLGMPDTSQITLDEMILHARAVSRAAAHSFTIGDLPMGCYEVSEEQALRSAIRMVKEGRMQSVKLEGGLVFANTIKKITDAGIPVCGHIGLTPQRQHALGGFRVQGKTASAAEKLLKDARAVQDAGAFAMVLECVPREIASIITSKLRIPTISIGAGNGCSGQVLVQMDMLGCRPQDSFLPKFVKRYGDVWERSLAAIEQYRDEVKTRSYPAERHNYAVDKATVEAFKAIADRSDNINP
jgi:3-methyl-2-oxobutanoate hydroxymethyltransferase